MFNGKAISDWFARSMPIYTNKNMAGLLLRMASEMLLGRPQNRSTAQELTRLCPDQAIFVISTYSERKNSEGVANQS